MSIGVCVVVVVFRVVTLLVWDQLLKGFSNTIIHQTLQKGKASIIQVKFESVGYPNLLRIIALFDILTVPRRYYFSGSFMFLLCLVFAMYLCASVYMCFVVTCWERADLLALVCGVYCEFVTFPLVSWVRCGT